MMFCLSLHVFVHVVAARQFCLEAPTQKFSHHSTGVSFPVAPHAGISVSLEALYLLFWSTAAIFNLEPVLRNDRMEKVLYCAP